MPATEQELRQTVVEIGKLMHQKGWVAANDGNISVRLGPDHILSTPTRVSKGMMREDDLIICDMKGTKVAGKRDRTSEILMHLTVYEMRPDVGAVVHAHPPVATGFAVAGRPLNLALLPEIIIHLGWVPLVDYGLPGTPALSEPLKPFIPTYDAVLMANHGATTWGEDLQAAFFRMEMIEHFARITLVAELLGGPKVLPKDEVDKLIEARGRYGASSPRTNLDEGCPVTAEEASPTLPRQGVTREELIALLDDYLRVRG